jgi:hypothetical protein
MCVEYECFYISVALLKEKRLIYMFKRIEWRMFLSWNWTLDDENRLKYSQNTKKEIIYATYIWSVLETIVKTMLRHYWWLRYCDDDSSTHYSKKNLFPITFVLQYSTSAYVMPFLSVQKEKKMFSFSFSTQNEQLNWIDGITQRLMSLGLSFLRRKEEKTYYSRFFTGRKRVRLHKRYYKKSYINTLYQLYFFILYTQFLVIFKKNVRWT